MKTRLDIGLGSMNILEKKNNPNQTTEDMKHPVWVARPGG